MSDVMFLIVATMQNRKSSQCWIMIRTYKSATQR